MTHQLALFTSTVCCLGALAACEQASVGSTSTQPAQSLPTTAHVAIAPALNMRKAPGDRVGMYRMSWPKLSQSERLNRIHAAAATLAQRQLQLVRADIPDREWVLPVDDTKLRVHYHERFNEVRIRDEGATQMGTPSADIGERAARSQAGAFLNDLATAGFVNGGHYTIDTAETGHMRGGRVGGSPQDEWLVEYRFKMFRKVNGIEVAGTRLTIGISPTGRRSSLRHGGLKIDSTGVADEEVPMATGHTAIRQVTADEIAKRFSEEVEVGERKMVRREREMYMIPEGVSEAVVGPSRIVEYSRVMTSRNGEDVFAPARTVGFSLTQRQKPFDDHSMPATQATATSATDRRHN
jgi:hypothetical protein